MRGDESGQTYFLGQRLCADSAELTITGMLGPEEGWSSGQRGWGKGRDQGQCKVGTACSGRASPGPSGHP